MLIHSKHKTWIIYGCWVQKVFNVPMTLLSHYWCCWRTLHSFVVSLVSPPMFVHIELPCPGSGLQQIMVMISRHIQIIRTWIIQGAQTNQPWLAQTPLTTDVFQPPLAVWVMHTGPACGIVEKLIDVILYEYHAHKRADIWRMYIVLTLIQRFQYLIWHQL